MDFSHKQKTHKKQQQTNKQNKFHVKITSVIQYNAIVTFLSLFTIKPCMLLLLNEKEIV